MHVLTPTARTWVSTLFRVALAAVLLAAGGLKITDPGAAVRAVQAYELLPVLWLDQVVGIGLPVLEVVLGLLLLLGAFTRLAAGATGALMVVFVLAVSSAWARGLSIDCGCFGGGGSIAPEATRYWQEILRDLLFLALACWLVAFPASRFALDRHREPSDGLADTDLGDDPDLPDDARHDTSHDTRHDSERLP